ncbi:MAG TPA: fused MFS/spermidine synthase [Chloroflexota bacterium]
MRISNPWIACSIVFVASFCTLVIELIAGRIMAPYIGVSLYTWTSIIGVCLAGISLGNYVGGRLADRLASNVTLGALFLLSGLSSLLILALIETVITYDIGRSVPLILRIVAYTAGIFFLPTFILGMISPVVIKLSLVDLSRTGSIVGRIYAVSTAGSIVGTFVTGFYLIEALGTRSIVWVVAILLILMGLLIGQFWRTPVRVSALVLVVAFVSFFYTQRDAYAAPCVQESSYYCIRISQATLEGRTVKTLVLDHLVHSYVDLDDPKFIGYGYERVYAELTEWHTSNKPEFRTLSIGGGGYTFPKYVTASYPGAHADVLELDPAVTRAAHEYLKLPYDDRIRTYNSDARLWFIENRPVGQYDLIYGDAFNDLSVPYHLTTLEFDRMVRRSMRDDGILMTNIIDNYQSGEFLRAYLRTLTESFEHVYLVGLGAAWEGRGASTYVAVASPTSLNIDSFMEFEGQTTRRQKSAAVMDDRMLREYLDSGRRIVLTDDYAPVDNLVARLFIERGY